MSCTRSISTSLSKTIADNLKTWPLIGNVGAHTARGFDIVPAWVAGIVDVVVAEVDDNCNTAAAQDDIMTDRLTVLMRMSKQLVMRILTDWRYKSMHSH